MSTKRFMVRTPDGVVTGPHSSSELVQLAAGGALTPECEVQLDGGTAWHPATKVKGLQFSGQAVPPPAMAQASLPSASASPPVAAAGASNTIPIFMHLSVLSGLVIPFGGLVVPLVLVGILLLALGAVAVIVFAIMGAIKLSKGEFFRYPMPFRLIK